MKNMDNEEELEFIPYKEAIELHALGFTGKCFGKIDQTGYLHIKGKKGGPRGSMMYDIIDCPLYSQAFRWFRKKHNLNSFIANGYDDYEKLSGFEFWFVITEDSSSSPYFKTYEEAELACLRKLIEIITNNK